MITKCEHPGCTKAGVCRAPKTRDLKEYWYFCKEHAAEYNKNWNYYANMTPDEIDAEWERETFGIADKDRDVANQKEAEYAKFINDFLTGRSSFDKMPAKKPYHHKSHLHFVYLNYQLLHHGVKSVQNIAHLQRNITLIRHDHQNHQAKNLQKFHLHTRH